MRAPLLKQTLSESKPTIEYCGTNGYVRYAGVHLIIELWEAEHFTDAEKIEAILREAVVACEATLLHFHIHEFSPDGGVTGIGVLSESHISIHTWPEYEYAALDLFVCGTKDPYKAVPVLKAGFAPRRMQVTEHKRGILS